MSESDETIRRYGVTEPADRWGHWLISVGLTALFVAVAIAFGWKVRLILGAAAFRRVMDLVYGRNALLEIRPTEIHYIGTHWGKFWGSTPGRRVLALPDVDRIEWPGGDNIGIRLKSGDIVSIDLMVLPSEQWDAARRDVLEAIERCQKRVAGSQQETPRGDVALV